VLRDLGLALLALAVMIGLPSEGRAQAPSVTLTPSVASPQKLGTPVTWTAAVQNAPTGHTYGYQFSVTFNGEAQIVQDFSSVATFLWVPHTVEGAYTVTVTTRDTTTPPFTKFAPVSASFTLQPWVTAPNTQAVNATAHPLVALFSGPPCTAGHQLLVRFRPANSQASMTTNFVPCSEESANFLVAGMYPSTEYLMHWEEYDGTSLVTIGAALSFTTGAIPSKISVPKVQVLVPPTAHDAAYPVILWGFLGSAPAATDLAGKVIWYSPGPQVVRMDAGGTFFSFGATGGSFNGTGTLTQYDLGGNQITQTNLEILNEQLTAKGYPTMSDFNAHEARSLPNGNVLLLGSEDKPFTNEQGGTPSNPVDIIGDMALVLDHNMQVLWAWDSFAHEDVSRKAILGETCTHGQGGCPNFSSSFTVANDWLHSNSAQMTADGNIIISQRHQDWVIKIDYANGAGDGHVIWRMGPAGDFTILNPPSENCGDPNDVYPWFTHQHDAAFQFEENASDGAGTVMTVFDDGNTRAAKCPGTQNSRGMVLFVNESAKQVYIETQGNLGAFSGALGSGQLFAGGDGNLYSSYSNGALATGAEATELNLAGQIVYELGLSGFSYRSYRMPNLYTPTFPFTATGVYATTTTPLSFGNIPFVSTEVLPVTVANFGVPGTATVGTTIEGVSFKVLTTTQNTCSAGITAGQSCTLPVEFAPATVGAHHELLLLDNEQPPASTMELDGVAAPAGTPVAQVSPNYLPFGIVPFGASATLPLTVTNIGGGTLTVTPSIVAYGTPGKTPINFTIASSTCGAGLTSGASCTLQIQFTPTSITTHSDLLTLQTNGPGNPTVGLQGVVSGLSVLGGVSGGSLQFGSVSSGSTEVKSLTITNVGVPGTVKIGTTIKAGSSLGGPYTILTTGNTCLAGISAGQSCTLPVQFAPTSSGVHNDFLVLTPSTGGGSTNLWLVGSTP
jgi:hypothetical protein